MSPKRGGTHARTAIPRHEAELQLGFLPPGADERAQRRNTRDHVRRRATRGGGWQRRGPAVALAGARRTGAAAPGALSLPAARRGLRRRADLGRLAAPWRA